MSRGYLIFPFLAELHRLDTRSLAGTDPDGAGPLANGYDPDFKEPVLIDRDDDGVAERYRLELPPVRVPCQVETEALEVERPTGSGNAPGSRLTLVLHFRDLERLGLVDLETGEALIRPSDRLGALYDLGGRRVQRFRDPPGLYVIEARPSGFGLHYVRPQRNLLIVALRDRPRTRSVG